MDLHASNAGAGAVAGAANGAPVRPPMPAARVVLVRYVLFAVAAGLANLLTQEAVHRIVGPGLLLVAIGAGTVVGFVMKYVLDRRWIFRDPVEAGREEVRKAAGYTLFAVGTTLLFWAVELAAWAIWQTPTAKYAGAVAGLSLGNWIKYRLDKRYVFRRG